MAESWADLGTVANAPSAAEAGEDWSDLGVTTPKRKRSNTERFGQNVEDATRRNPTVATARNVFTNPLSVLPGSALPGQPGGSGPSILSFLPGAQGGLAVAGVLSRGLGVRPPSLLDAGAERERRAAYDAQSEADPFYKADGGLLGKATAGLSTFGGQLIGGLTDPQNVVGAGRNPLARIGSGIGINAAGDVQAQTADVGAGVQDRYSPVQTGFSAALGGVIQGGQEAFVPLARTAGRKIAPAVEAAKRKAGEIVEGFDGSRPIAGRERDADWSDLGSPARGSEDWSDLGSARQPPAREARSVWTEADAREIVGRSVPGATITSGYRTPEHNARVGGVKGSYHTLGRALDIVPPKGMSMAELAAQMRTAMPGAKIINEGDHVHVQWGGKGGRARVARPSSLGPDLDRLLADEPAVEVEASRGPLELANRQDADGAGAPGLGRGDEPGSGSESGGRFLDENHARLYDLGRKALSGEVDDAEAEALARSMAPFMDWTDEPDLAPRERQLWRDQGRVTGRRMIEAAKAFAQESDAPENAGRAVSYYDAERYADALQPGARSEKGTNFRPYSTADWRDLGADNQGLPGASDDNPIPTRATPRAEPPPTSARDLTDDVLDLMRSGRRAPRRSDASLLDYLADRGLLDEAGELSAMDVDAWHRGKPFRKRLVRPGGRTLEDAAVAAQELGYLPQRAGGGGDPRATPEELLAAIREELAGRPRYASERPDVEALRQHYADVDEVLNYLGIDPRSGDNAAIKKAIDQAFMSPERRAMRGGSRRPAANQGQLPGMDKGNDAATEIELERRRREARRGADTLPEGSLFDETRRGEQDMFGRRGMFAGRRSKTSNTEALDRAKAMERAGRETDAIRRATGWFRGDDQQWRYEFADDSALFRAGTIPGLFGERSAGIARLRELAQHGGMARLDSIIEHPKLFSAYPWLRRTSVAIDADLRGLAATDGKVIYVSPGALEMDPGELRGVMLHEIQHLVQEREGFALGAGADADTLKAEGYGPALARRISEMRDKGYKTDTAVPEVYQRSAGEIEARNTQFRRWMGDSTRKAVPPDQTRDIGRDEAIVVRRTATGPREMQRRAAIDLSAYGDAIKASRSGNVVGARASKAAKVGEGTAEYARQTVSQLADKLRASLGITHRQGRLTLKGGAVGEFDPRSGIIRTRAAKDAIDHLAHEAGHKLWFKSKPGIMAAIRASKRQLEPMAYEGANPAHRLEEGFAEFFKAYVLNPSEARLRAPNFYDKFEAAIAEDLPQVAADLLAIQKAYGDLLDAAALDVATASVAYTGRPGVTGRLAEAYRELGPGGFALRAADEIYRGIWDQKHPFNVFLREVQRQAVKNTGKRLEMPAADNPYVQSRVADHAFAVGRSDLANGVTPYRGVDPEGPTVPGIYAKAFGKKEPTPEEDGRFGAYLISRRMRHEWDRYYRGELENPPDKVEQDKAFHERVVEDAEKLHPSWKEAAEMATDWNRRQWKLWFDAGFIGEKTYKRGIEDHPDYVPLQRDMTDKGAPGGAGGRARGIGQFAGGVDAFVGSQRDIIHPIISMTRRAFEIRAAIARNEVIRSMWDAAEKAGNDNGHLIEQLPAKQWEVVKVDAMEALNAVAKAMGLSDRDRSAFEVFHGNELEGAIQAELFRQTELSPRKGESIVFMWKDGEKVPLLLPDGWLGRKLFDAISGLTKDTRALWEEIAAGAANALRMGVTGMPEFALKTSIRDQMAAAILTDVGFKPYLDTARGMGEVLTHGKTARRYEAAGGLRGGVNVAATRRPFPRDDVQAKEQMERIRGGSLPRRVMARGVRVKDAGELASVVAHLVDIGDTATRVAVFRRAMAKAKAKGATDYQAAVEARHLSADFFDPSRHGAWPAVVQLARTVPFFNSGLQGPDVLVRTVRHAFARPETMQDKAKFRRAWWALSMLGATAALGATVALAWSDDPEFQNINDQVRATHWPIFKRPNGEWVLYPKSFELGMPSNLVERGIEWLKNRDPRILERVRKDILNTSVPTRDAPVLAVPFQAARNRDRTGKPIVPEHLRGTVDPRFQVNSWTSETAKVIAGNVISPAVLEHYIAGFLGTGGRDALRLGDMAISASRGEPKMKGRAPDMYMTRGFVRRTARGSDAEENFWKLAAKDGALELASNSFRLLAREGDDAKAREYLSKLSPEARTYAASQILLGGKIAKSHPIVRARTALGVLGAIRRENRAGELVGANNRLIQLTPSQRREVDDALDDLALVEAHNAQVAAGVRGWAQRDFMNRREPLDRLAAVAPPVAQAVNLRLAQEGVLPIKSAAKVWNAAERMVSAMTPAQMSAMLMKTRMDTAPERRSEVRRLGAANALAGTSQPNALAVARSASPARLNELASVPSRANVLARQ